MRHNKKKKIQTTNKPTKWKRHKSNLGCYLKQIKTKLHHHTQKNTKKKKKKRKKRTKQAKKKRKGYQQFFQFDFAEIRRMHEVASNL